MAEDFFPWRNFYKWFFPGDFSWIFFPGYFLLWGSFPGGNICGHHLDTVFQFLKTPLNSFHIILTKLVIIKGKALLRLLFISSGTSCTTLQNFEICNYTIRMGEKPERKKVSLGEKVSLPRGKLDQMSFSNQV